MSPISVIITIAAYFVILFTISYIAGRKADNEGFFVGNRKSAWYVDRKSTRLNSSHAT